MKDRYEIRDHGVSHEQFFQGCGVSFTKFDHCVTGIGSCEEEALNDALNQMSEGGAPEDLIDFIDVADVPLANISDDAHGDGYYHYVSVLWKNPTLEAKVEKPKAAKA